LLDNVNEEAVVTPTDKHVADRLSRTENTQACMSKGVRCCCWIWNI